MLLCKSLVLRLMVVVGMNGLGDRVIGKNVLTGNKYLHNIFLVIYCQVSHDIGRT